MPSKYTVKLVVGTDLETGKQIRKTFSGKTKKEACAKRDEYKFKMLHGLVTYDFMTFKEVSEEWLNLSKEDVVSAASYRGYRFFVDLCNDYFKKRAIQSITTADLNKFMKKYTDKSESYMHFIKITLKQIFRYAFQADYIPKNPTEGMTNMHGVEPKEKKPYSEEEMRKVVDFSKEHEEGLGIFITLKTGLRRGELTGLRTTDFDMERKRLNVVRTAKDGAVGSDIIKEGGKTKNSVRTIPLDDETVEYLRTREEFRTDRYVIQDSKSNPIPPQKYAMLHHAKFMKDLEESIGIRTLTPHYLRHTYGTHLFRLGNDLFRIMKIMGHSSIETTSRIYVHETIDDIEKGLIL